MKYTQLQLIFGIEDFINTWYSILVTIYIVAK